jgi:S1-C subfamily serine protease
MSLNITCALQNVVAKAKEFTAKLGSGEEYDLSLCGADPEHNLAILHTSGRNTPWVSVSLGESETLQVGQYAFAIGFTGGEALSAFPST